MRMLIENIIAATANNIPRHMHVCMYMYLAQREISEAVAMYSLETHIQYCTNEIANRLYARILSHGNLQIRIT